MMRNRFHGLLVADDGELEYQSLCEECAEDIKQVRTPQQCLLDVHVLGVCN